MLNTKNREEITSNVVDFESILENSIYKKFIHTQEDEAGRLKHISFQNEDSFNFAFDVLDVLGKECGEKTAMLHLDKNKNEKKFTFKELMHLTNKTVNYFENLGIKKGDKVMLVLKRHYQFWTCILALHKIGAIAIPATSQLQERDYVYRFELAEVSAIICTPDDNVPQNVENALENLSKPQIKIIVNQSRPGWHHLEEESQNFSCEFDRKATSPCGKDTMFMFFTSGTTGYPKIAAHDYKYPLGHFVTAKYWHNASPGKLHFTVSDTGWGKALWGKLYGQWLCGSIVFVYDFDRFSAADILPMFKEYGITTFCAPPTVYRMMIKESPEKYDLSSLRCVTTAGEPLNPEVYKQFADATGLKIMEGFGQTETTLIIGTLYGMTPKAGSMGKSIPSYKIGLMDSEGNECGVNETGEIVIYDSDNKMCGLFCGYYNRDDLTNDVHHDGAYHTGDLATKDSDGYFWYVGRTDDIIKSSGYKIGPFEIENVIMELPYVLECAVSGEPDEIRGQIIKASIVLTKGTVPSDDLKLEIQSYVKSKTAPYKYPRKIIFTNELPKTISGKTIRNKL